MLTASGGGILRDVTVNRIPILLKNPVSVCITLAVVLVSLIFGLHRKGDIEHRWIFIVSDAIGLVAFSITGALVGLETELSLFGVMWLGFITAVGGGVLRDILVNDVPLILRSEFYGSVALLVALLLYLLHSQQWLTPTSIGIVGGIGVFLRLISFSRNWHLPKL